MFGRREKVDGGSKGGDPRDLALAYHRASCHEAYRFAPGPDDLDWATQPDPFRRYAGARLVALDRPEPDGLEPRYERAFRSGAIAPAPLARASLSQLLFDSLAISAWKRAGESRWALRCNPSSGNLHPTEGYVIAPALAGVSEKPFVAHYAPEPHALELRALLEPELASHFAADGTLLVGLTSIHWREAWKYGVRAFRYCQHDVGHAIGALAVAAAGLGWRARVFDDPSSEQLAALLGVASQLGPEREEPEVLVAIDTCGGESLASAPDAGALARAAALAWSGTPNDLSPGHVEWSWIDAVAEATRRPRMSEPLADVQRFLPWQPGDEALSLRHIVRSRRSAVAFDARSGVARDAFVQTLRRTLPRERESVLSCWPYETEIDLALFVHRVEGLDPGLYLCLRDPRRESAWRDACAPSLEWARVEAGDLPLFCLRRGDARTLARSVSCGQDIAADGCFSLGMFAPLRAALARRGPWYYRRLFWEAGLIGQLLYLEAEALGLRGTGIGCYFDGAAHGAFALRGDAFASLYHFTLGRAVDDPRITSEPSYPEEELR